MQDYYDFGISIGDYQKDLLDHIEEYNHLEMYHEHTQREAKRLRGIYDEMTSNAIYSKRFKARNGREYTTYFYATKEDYEKKHELFYWWWSDLLSVTVGND